MNKCAWLFVDAARRHLSISEHPSSGSLVCCRSPPQTAAVEDQIKKADHQLEGMISLSCDKSSANIIWDPLCELPLS